MTHLRAGSASDVGQLRSNNQDSQLVADDMAVFAVADGMGGHQGGEVASALAIATLADVLTAPSTEALVEAVREANRRIFAQAGETPELRGMGTTLVAIALVDRGTDTEELTWVNVGDSRVYVLRDGQLVQLSQDHSLVEDLRRGGQLSAEEAAVHPQRNILTRALGIDAEVEVDWHGVEPFVGDRYLLCSDGLFNEVDDEAIIEALTAMEDPDEAAAELVRRANEGGGRDNITCVVVDVVDDGGRAERAAAAGRRGTAALTAGPGAGAGVEAAPPPTVEMPAVVPDEDPDTALADRDPAPPTHVSQPTPGAPAPPEPGEEDTAIRAGASAYPVDDDPDGDPDIELPFGRTTTDLYDDMDKVGGRHRAMVVAITVLVLGFLGGAAVLGIRYLDSDGYFVRADGERVVIYQGRPGGGILFGPRERGVGQTPITDLTPQDRARLERTPEFGSLADAFTEVNTWDARARQAAAREAVEEEEPAEPSPTTAPTTDAPASTPSTNRTTQQTQDNPLGASTNPLAGGGGG